MAVPLPVVTYEQRSGLLIVTARGIIQIDWFIGLIGDIAIRSEMNKSKGILVDGREITGQMSFVDRYRAGYKAANSWLMVPVAIVGSETLVDPGRLGEMVARNRGVNVRVFTEITEAERWLEMCMTSSPNK